MFQTPISVRSNPKETISEAIGADHRYFDTCYEHIVSATDLEEKLKWRNQLTWTVARHAVSEELTWYGALEKHLGAEGKKLADEDREQHQAVKADLSKLQSLSPTSPEFSPLLERLMHDLHTHIAHERDEDMPRLEGLLSRDESRALAASFQRTKMIAPTRSHPSAPNQPPLETLASLLAAPIDKLADLVRSFPDTDKVAAPMERL